MRASLSWLKELVPGLAERGAAEIARALTARGLEVESVEEVGGELVGLLVAEILDVRSHPEAEKLRLVRVKAGERVEDVVCGAPNVPGTGNRVCWGPPGARLPGGRVLEAKEVRGVMSPGMLCSESELGLSDKGDGILILSPDDPTGADFSSLFGVSDEILEVNVTPNRGDALSHLGLARELAAAFGTPLRRPEGPSVRSAAGARVTDVLLEDPAACARYQARFVTDVTVRPSPLRMRLRLARCGVRPVSNLVDVTNYVLLESGHPLHAFDLERLEGPIVVRRAREGELLRTLDGIDRRLAGGDIVIADVRGPVALAGVMGGAQSEVTDRTRQVLLEAATFDPAAIRRTSKRLGLSSEASYRYERGVDANGIPFAAARAASLMAGLGGGALVEAVVDRYPRPVLPHRVSLSLSRLRRVSGVAYGAEEARAALAQVAESVDVDTHQGETRLLATIPTYRRDITIPEDLIEEVLRVGNQFERPARAELVVANSVSVPHPEGAHDRARSLLAAAGLCEIVTWAFVPRTRLEAIGGKATDLTDGVVVKNPISADYEVMRTSLLPGLADALARNMARGVRDPWLFEVGPVVRKRSVTETDARAGAGPLQLSFAAGLLAGRRPGWLKPGDLIDFFDAKRALEALLQGFGVSDAILVPGAGAPFLHPGVSADVQLATGQRLGGIGELHPLVARRLDLAERAFYFEVDLDLLAGGRQELRSTPPPRFPASTRDVSFWIDAAVPAALQSQAFVAAAEPLLRELTVLEDFRDPKHTPAGKKGMLWSMTYRADDRTLTDGEADAAHARVVNALKSRHVIEVR